MKAIIWDMDGTLVDSEILWEKATYEMSEALGKRLTPQQRETCIGTSFTFTFELCARNAGHDPDSLDRAWWKNFLYSRMDTLMATELELRPGVRELLDACKAASIPMAIATNTERRVAQVPFGAIGLDYFETTVCGDEVPQAKPAPDMYREAARRLGCEPKECLVFEDSFGGMTAATNAGCVVIGLPEKPDMDLPKAVCAMRTLNNGSIDFAGVTVPSIRQWYERALNYGEGYEYGQSS